jgi:class 3 adenylate cyclase
LVRVDRYEEAVLVRCSIEWLEASSNAGGVDADRDRYLKRLLVERLSADRFEELREKSHEMTGDETVKLALEAIGDELTSRRRVSEFRVIVFTDLERSTQFLADTGDVSGRAAMRKYDVRTNEALARHDGERVKGTGDGVLATFSSVAAAINFVTELLRDVDEAVDRGDLPLRLRVGIHAGETIADMGDVHGTVVNLTARVVDRADGGEILVTDTIRQIAVGSDHTFTNLGEADLKGIPEPMRLHRLELA